MSKKELNKKTSELIITVEADKKMWADKQKNAFDLLAKDLQVAGFRKGKVPQNIAKQKIAQADIFTKAIQKALDEMIKEAAKEIKDEMILDSPTYSVKKLTENMLEVDFIYPVYPEFKLPDYKNLKTKYKEQPLGKDVVKNELEQITKQQAMLIPKDGNIAKGDIANFDFEGSVNGKKFDGGEAKGYELEIGSGQFIPGFEDQMVGMKKGESKDVEVKFPENYHSADLKGKDAVFKVKVNEIKQKQPAKMDDELVKGLNIPDVKTVAELKKYIEKISKEQLKQSAKGEFHRAAFAEIKQQTEIAIPQSLVANEMQNIAKQFEQQLAQQGMNYEQFMKMSGATKEMLASQHRAQAEERLKDSLIFAEVAKLEKIELSEADYEAEYKKLAQVYRQTVEGIKGSITKAQMQIPMTNDRVLDIMIKSNQSKTTTAKKPAVKKETVKKTTTKATQK